MDAFFLLWQLQLMVPWNSRSHLSNALESLPTNYAASAAWRSDTAPWKCTCTESALISPRSSHVCIMIRMKNQIYGISFLLISFPLFNCTFSTSLGHTRFSCLDVCLILFTWRCLFWIQICKIAENVVIKSRTEIRLKVYKKLVIFMKNWL